MALVLVLAVHSTPTTSSVFSSLNSVLIHSLTTPHSLTLSFFSLSSLYTRNSELGTSGFWKLALDVCLLRSACCALNCMCGPPPPPSSPRCDAGMNGNGALFLFVALALNGLDERVNGFFLVALAWTHCCIWDLGIGNCDLRLATCDL